MKLIAVLCGHRRHFEDWLREVMPCDRPKFRPVYDQESVDRLRGSDIAQTIELTSFGEAGRNKDIKYIIDVLNTMRRT